MQFEKTVKFLFLALALVLLFRVAMAAEPTAEQLEIMKQYGLSVPPVILDKDGHDKASAKPETPKIPDIANDHVTAKEEIKVHATENGKQIDVTFSPFGDPFELSNKKTETIKKIDWIESEIGKIQLERKKETRAEIVSVGIELANDDNFEVLVEKRAGAVFADFYADWCAPCRGLAPTIEALSREMTGIQFVKIDYDHTVFFRSKYGINNLPCMMIFVDGKLVATRVGASPKDDIKNWVISTVPQCGYRSPQSIPAAERVIIDKTEYRPEYRQEQPAVRMHAGRGVHD